MVATLFAVLAALAAAAAATMAARSAGKSRAAAEEAIGSLGRVRAEVKAQMADCPTCQAGEVDEHTRTWRLVAGGK